MGLHPITDGQYFVFKGRLWRRVICGSLMMNGSELMSARQAERTGLVDRQRADQNRKLVKTSMYATR